MDKNVVLFVFQNRIPLGKVVNFNTITKEVTRNTRSKLEGSG